MSSNDEQSQSSEQQDSYVFTVMTLSVCLLMFVISCMRLFRCGHENQHRAFASFPTGIASLHPPSRSHDEILQQIRVMQWSDVSKEVITRSHLSASSSMHSKGSTADGYFLGQEGCAICLSNFDPKDVVCQSKNKACTHTFHLSCMEPWLAKHDDCPVCRANFLVEGAEEPV